MQHIKICYPGLHSEAVSRNKNNEEYFQEILITQEREFKIFTTFGRFCLYVIMLVRDILIYVTVYI